MTEMTLDGVYAALVTPYDAEGRVSAEQVARCLHRQAEGGAHGALLAGTTGEGPSLSVAERIGLFQAAATAESGLKLLAGTGAASLEDAATLTAAAFDSGMDAALIIPPFFYKSADDEGLFAFFSALIDRAVPADGAVMLYHNPVVAAVGVSFELIDRLRDAYPDQVVGIKDSSQDPDNARRLIEQFPGFRVFVGDDTLLSGAMALGGAGLISLVTNAFPDLSRALYDACRAGKDPATAQERLSAARKQFAGVPSIAAVKLILQAGGVIDRATVRPPLRPLGKDEETLVRERFMLDRPVPTSLSLNDLAALFDDDSTPEG